MLGIHRHLPMPHRAVRMTPAALAPRSVADALRSAAMPLGCPVGYLERPRVARLTRQACADPVVRTFAREQVGVVSSPDVAGWPSALDDEAVQELLALTRNETRPGSVVDLPGLRLEVSDHPAALAVADHGTLGPEIPPPVAAIVHQPSAFVRGMLKYDVSADDWRRGGGDDPAVLRVGALSAGVLVAMASAEPAVGHLTRVRVVVAPSFRRRGYARALVRTLAMQALSEGLLPACRVDAHDAAAQALASRVGFVPFARALTLRVMPVAQDELAAAVD